ncbi:MAG: M14 family zinc carboxypeptidase [Pseudomonadota bacterium]
MIRLLSCLVLLLTWSLSSNTLAQNPGDARATMDYYLPADVDYDPSIPTPEEILGRVPGDWHVRHDQLVHYMRTMAEASDRISIETFGYTHEQRPLLRLTITSPDNHRNLETLRQQHVALSDPARSGDLNPADMPVVLYQGYSIHGNEPSGANASLLYVYHLAAARGTEIEAALDNAIIHVDPSFNPDGLNRFAHWVTTRRAEHLSSDPANMEQNEAWPGGRTNHYWFDLNRDWLPAQHPESQARLDNFHLWKPNVLTDHHEMGSDATFFFQPGIPERTHPLTPRSNQALTDDLAQFHARLLDEDQRLYYSRESFDDFYYGKGSTYPDINGSIGILFEQASSRGHARETMHGELRFPFTIKNQFLASLSTLEGALAHRVELLEHQRDFYREARDMARESAIRGWVFGSDADRGSAFRLAEILRRHRIEVHELARNLEADGHAFEAGRAYVVPADQDQFRLIEAVFERRTEFPDTLFYDISTWTLPLAFDTPFAELGSRRFSDDLLGPPVGLDDFPAGSVVGGDSGYAYLFEWDEFHAPRALYRLLDAGVRATVATEPFTAMTGDGPREFDYGTVLVAMGPQDTDAQTIHQLIRQAAEEDALTVYSVETGLTPEGIDLGSRQFAELRTPRVAVVTGSGTSAYETGEIWHTFDQKFAMPVTLIERDRLNGVDLDEYNVLVMASGDYGPVDADRIRTWVEQGGTLIAYKSALDWVEAEEIANIELITEDGDGEGDEESGEEREEQKEEAGDDPKTYADLTRDRGEQLIGGSIFLANLDLSHPLGYGYNRPVLPVFRDSTRFMARAENQYATPLNYTDAPLASGYVSDENLEKLAGTAAIVVGGQGDGRVIAMTDNPNFRAFWYGTTRLFMNAVFFGHTIDDGAVN